MRQSDNNLEKDEQKIANPFWLNEAKNWIFIFSQSKYFTKRFGLHCREVIFSTVAFK